MNNLFTECYRYSIYITDAGGWPAPSKKSTGSQVGNQPLSFPDSLQSGHLLGKNYVCWFLFNLLLHVPSKWPSQLTFGQRSCDSERLRGKSCEVAQPIDRQKSKNSLILLTDTPDVLIRHVNRLVWVWRANDSLSAEFLSVCLRPEVTSRRRWAHFLLFICDA